MSTRVVLLGNLESLDRGEAKRVSIPVVKHSVARQEVADLPRSLPRTGSHRSESASQALAQKGKIMYSSTVARKNTSARANYVRASQNASIGRLWRGARQAR